MSGPKLVQIAKAEVPEINQAFVMLQAQINLLKSDMAVDVVALQGRITALEAEVARSTAKTTRRA